MQANTAALAVVRKAAILGRTLFRTRLINDTDQIFPIRDGDTEIPSTARRHRIRLLHDRLAR